MQKKKQHKKMEADFWGSYFSDIFFLFILLYSVFFLF